MAIDLNVAGALKVALRTLGTPQFVYRNVVRANARFNGSHVMEMWRSATGTPASPIARSAAAGGSTRWTASTTARCCRSSRGCSGCPPRASRIRSAWPTAPSPVSMSCRGRNRHRCPQSGRGHGRQRRGAGRLRPARPGGAARRGGGRTDRRPDGLPPDACAPRALAAPPAPGRRQRRGRQAAVRDPPGFDLGPAAWKRCWPRSPTTPRPRSAGASSPCWCARATACAARPSPACRPGASRRWSRGPTARARLRAGDRARGPRERRQAGADGR